MQVPTWLELLTQRWVQCECKIAVLSLYGILPAFNIDEMTFTQKALHIYETVEWGTTSFSHHVTQAKMWVIC